MTGLVSYKVPSELPRPAAQCAGKRLARCDGVSKRFCSYCSGSGPPRPIRCSLHPGLLASFPAPSLIGRRSRHPRAGRSWAPTPGQSPRTHQQPPNDAHAVCRDGPLHREWSLRPAEPGYSVVFDVTHRPIHLLEGPILPGVMETSPATVTGGLSRCQLTPGVAPVGIRR